MVIDDFNIVGVAIAPAKAITAFNAIQGHATSNVASITQKAAIAALSGPQESVAMMHNEYLQRRDRVWEWLTEDPRFGCVKPRGAFYLFPYIAEALEPAGVRTSAEFAEALLNDAHVALTGLYRPAGRSGPRLVIRGFVMMGGVTIQN